MKGIVTTLTDKEQSMSRTVLLAGKATLGTCLRCVVGVHFHRHGASQSGFVSNHALQLSERPRRGVLISAALLLAGSLAMCARRAFTDVGQVLKPNDAGWVRGDDARSYGVIGLQLQPSLSPAYHLEAAGCGSSAFVLQSLTQSCVVIGFGSHSLARMKRCSGARVRRHGKVTLSHIDTYHVSIRPRQRILDKFGQ
jgi:hypothetical protein